MLNNKPMKLFISKTLFIITLLFLHKTVIAQSKAENEIRKVLAEQTEAWNKADIQGFMQGYWASDSLKFIGKNGVTKGWNATLNNYKKSYPDKAAMGTLTFDILTVEKISSKAAFVIGKWKLQREKDVLQGHFTLFWKKIKSKWLIVADHSS
jgi:ketosteroid isomerase-like protein